MHTHLFITVVQVTIPHSRLVSLLSMPSPPEEVSRGKQLPPASESHIFNGRTSPETSQSGRTARQAAQDPQAAQLQLPFRPGQSQVQELGVRVPSEPHHPAPAAGVAERPPEGNPAGAVVRHAVTEGHVSLLLNCGLLARHCTDRSQYLFSVPDTGPLVRSFFVPSALNEMRYQHVW